MSRAVFAEYGNMSSPTVLFVLDRLRKHERAAAVRRARLRAGTGRGSRALRVTSPQATSDTTGIPCPPIHRAASGSPASPASPAPRHSRSLHREASPWRPPKTAFGFCLNTSTVRDKDGKSRPIVELIDIAAKAGYDAIEPWTSEIDDYLKARRHAEGPPASGSSDAGLKVADVIGFAEWIVEDEARRKKGLEQAKRDMDWAAEIGSPRIAAPPVGATGGASKRDDPKFTQPVIDLVAAADRYRALLDLGKSMGVTPVVEIWGFSKTLRRLGEALLRGGRERRRQGVRSCRTSTTSTRAAPTSPGLALLVRQRDRHLPRQRLPEDRPRQDHRRRPRLPRRRHRPAQGRVRRAAEDRATRVRVAGTVQPRLLEAGPERGREDRSREDEGGRPNVIAG